MFNHVFSILIAMVLISFPLHSSSYEVGTAGVTITVDSVADVIAVDGKCTLREAVIAANTDTGVPFNPGECPAGDGPDTIILPAGKYELLIDWSVEDVKTGDLDILESLTIQGQGADLTIIDGRSNYNGDRAIEIPGSATEVTLSGLTIQNSIASYEYGGGILNRGILNLVSIKLNKNGTSETDCGGGLFNDGTVLITSSQILDNIAEIGGGICNKGTLTITDSLVELNWSRFDGGGILQFDGTSTITRTSINENTARFDTGIALIGGVMTILDSTIADNISDDGGCAGITISDGTLTITNTTISDNQTDSGGSAGVGFCNDGGLSSLSYSTITNNSANPENDNGVGGLYVKGGQVRVNNSILAGNISKYHQDCLSVPGGIVSEGHNLVGNADGCNWVLAAGDLLGWPPTPLDPKLGPLTDNGGSTSTHALLSGSPAVDSADPENYPDQDQREVTRPQGNLPDRGSYEAVQMSIADVQVKEKIDGNIEASIQISLSGNNAREVSVNYNTEDGSAKAGSDFIDISGELNFQDSTLSKTIKVTILPDLIPEAQEEFYLKLSNETYSVVMDQIGKITILDADTWLQYLPVSIK